MQNICMSVVYFCQLTPVYREREELSIPQAEEASCAASALQTIQTCLLDSTHCCSLLHRATIGNLHSR